jgi:hypothetical protein
MGIHLPQSSRTCVRILRSEWVWIHFWGSGSQVHSSCLKEVLDAVKDLRKEPKGLRGRFKEIVKLTSTKDKITEYKNRLRTLRSNFVVRTIHLRNKPIDSINSQLLATIDTNFHVQKLTMVPPSMIFHLYSRLLEFIPLQTFL